MLFYGPVSSTARQPVGKYQGSTDEEHSIEEHREIIIGYSKRDRLLVVAFIERDDVIRMISARKADREERKDYENAKR